MPTDQEQQASGGISRRSMLRGGLMAGAGVATLGAVSAVLTGTAKASTATSGPQANWWWCYLCGGLYYSNYLGSPAGVCLSPNNSHKHSSARSSNYTMPNGVDTSSNFQAGWAWCYQCDLLFYGPGVADSACPGNENSGGYYGLHNRGGTNYGLYHDIPGAGSASGYQAEWTWCCNCQVLFWGPDASSSRCAGDPGHPHAPGSGTSYDMEISGA